MTPQEEQRWYAVYQAMNGKKSPQDFHNDIVPFIRFDYQTGRRKGYKNRYKLWWIERGVQPDEEYRIDLLRWIMNNISREEAKGLI